MAKFPMFQARKNSPLVRSIAPLSLSLALMTTPFLASMAIPSNALAASSNQRYEYDYKFDDIVKNIQTYHIFAGNVGDATETDTYAIGSANVNNNTFYVLSGAGIDTINKNLNPTNTLYEINGAAGHIAIIGNDISATATGNTAIMDAQFTGTLNSESTAYTNDKNYISRLTGAYISIGTVEGDYTETTVNTVAASNNSVIVKDGAVGLGYSVDASGLKSTGQYLTGVYVNAYNTNSDAQFTIYNNSVLIEYGNVSAHVAGAYVRTVTGNASMSGNSVTIEGGNIQADSITGATFVTQNLSELDKTLGFENNYSTATMYNNSVTITGGEDFNPIYIAGAYSTATASSIMSYNTVQLSNVTILNDDGDYDHTYYTNGYSIIAGAYIAPEYCGTSSNGQTLYSGTVNMEATYNSVTVDSGEIYGTVAGAVIVTQTPNNTKLIAGSTLSYNGTLSYNTVTIYGGTIKATEYDDSSSTTAYNGIFGAVYQGSTSDFVSNGGYLENTYSVTNNTVNIGFDATVEDNVQIAGGAFNDQGDKTALQYFTLTPNVNTYDGNTLNLYHLTGKTTNAVSASTVANFENINFVLGADDSSQFKESSIITISDTLYLGNGYDDDEDDADSNDGTVATKYANFALHSSLYNSLAIEDSVTLFTATSIDGNFSNLGENNSGTYTGTKGALLSQTWDIKTTETDDETTIMTATLKSTQIGEQAKVLGEVSIAGITALNSGADLMVSGAIPAAIQAIQVEQSQSSDIQSAEGILTNSTAATFMVTSAGTSRYNTGSHVDNNAISLNTGIAFGGEGSEGNWLLGGFFEYNKGSYSTYNSFSTGAVEGNGDIDSYGLGGFVRYDFDHADYNPYVEASLRAGYLSTDYATDDLNNYSSSSVGNGIAYEVDNMYLGAHVALGNIFQIHERITLDTSVSYFWTHQLENSKNLFGHDVDFDAINSHRMRINGRAYYTLTDDAAGTFSLYGGLGVEYEFDANARTYVDGYKADTPDLEGFTAIGDMGLRFTPKEISSLATEIGFTTYGGQREGFGVTASFMYTF